MLKNTPSLVFFRIPFFAITVLTACTWPLFLAKLPRLDVLLLVVLVFLGLLIARRHIFLIHALVFTIAFSHFVYQAELYQRQRLGLNETIRSAQILGKIVAFPKYTKNQEQLTALLQIQLKQALQRDDGSILLPENSRISLRCYQCRLTFQLGEVWSMQVRLKPPRGTASWGAFDYEKYALANKIVASGYILSDSAQLYSKEPHLLDTIRLVLQGRIQKFASTEAVVQTPFLSRKVSEVTGNNQALLLALIIGDRSHLDRADWDLFRDTGTSHLMAISGLHITLIFFLVTIIARRGLSLVLFCLPVRFSRPMMEICFQSTSLQACAMVLGVFCAMVYAGLAGLSLPTQRAAIMLVVVSIAWLLNKRINLLEALSTALLVLLLCFPLSTLHTGFWLSFTALVIITLLLKSREHSILIQGRLALAMVPITFIVFSQIIIVSPLANSLLIPFISFVILPITFLTLSLSLILPSELMGWPWLEYAWLTVNSLLDHLWLLLHYFSKSQQALSALIPPLSLNKVAIITAVFVSILLIFWRLLIARRLLVVLLLISILSTSAEKQQSGEFFITILDVGQGLAIVIETQQHRLIFDTGNAFSNSDSAEQVLIPYLQRHPQKPLHAIVISHADKDHIGGLSSLQQAFPANSVLINRRDDLPKDFAKKWGSRAEHCYAQHWFLDGVRFDIFPPLPADPWPKRNDASCVMKVSSAFGSALLPGDIERRAERFLLITQAHQLRADVLIAAHHGSRTSSSPAFLNQVKPKISIISAAFFSPYGHPHPDVLSRLKTHSQQVLNTAYSGSIKIDFLKDRIQTREYRALHPRFWYSEPLN